MSFDNNKLGITLATTISPKGIENQRAAIDTWVKLGFSVVSLNCIEEIELIKPFFPDVEFITVSRDAREKFGKPYVYLDDFFEYYKKSDNEVCAIINSDIHLIGINEGIIRFIKEEVRGSLIYGSRIDIDSLDNLNGKFVSTGFDYFFFDRSIIGTYPKEEFCLGQPFWDHWIIVSPIINNIKVKYIVNPIAYHVKHELNWDVVTGSEFTRYTLKKYHESLKRFDKDINLRSEWTVFLKIIDENSNQIFYSPREDNVSILVIYNTDGVDIETSETYASIKRQTYKKYRVVFDCSTELDFSSIEEDYVYCISEGSVINKNFFKLMLAFINGKESCMCGVKLKSDRYYVQEITPTTDLLMKVKIGLSNIFSDYIIYKRSFLQSQQEKSESKDYENVSIGAGLVEVGLQYHMKRILSKAEGKSLYIYGAGGHTRDLMQDFDFSKYKIRGIIDGNLAYKGKCINGYPVFFKGDIEGLQIDYILISSIVFEKEIYEELINVIDKSKIIRIYHN